MALQPLLTVLSGETTFALLRQVGLSLVVVGVLWAVVWGNGWLFKHKIFPWLEGVKARGAGVLDPDKQARAARGLLRAG